MNNRKNERILNALGRADDRYVEEAAPSKVGKKNVFEAEAIEAEAVTVTAPRRRFYGGRVAAAACACVAAGGLVFWGAVGGFGNLTEDPANAGSGDSGDSGEENVQTMSPEENGYHNFTMTKEQLHYCPWSCFIPDHFPEGYQLSGDAQCTQANGLVETNIEMDISIWLSNGIDDPEAEGYNPIHFMVTVGDNSVVESETVYELETLTVNDIAKMGKSGLIDCGNGVRVQVGRTDPELVSDEEMHDMIMSMPYARQWRVYDSGYHVEYLTMDEAYNTPFADLLPTVLPEGYSVAGLSPYAYTEYSVNGYCDISLYLSNGVLDPNLPNYCPIIYTVLNNVEIDTTSPVLDLLTLTPQDVEAAVEEGGFYVKYDTAMINVSFPCPDRVKPGEIYMMLKSAPCVADNADYNEDNGYTTVYLRQEELYSNPSIGQYAPRVYPEGFSLESAMYKTFEEGGHREFLDLYISNDNYRHGGSVENPNLIFFSVGFDDIYATVLSNSRPEYDIDTLTVRDIEERLQTDRGINFNCGENVIVCLTVDNPETISAEELYKMIMSMPISGNIEAAGIKTGKLPKGVVTNNVPVVDVNEYYDVQRYPIGEEILGEHGTICGFDGENLYIRDSFREGDYYDIYSPIGSSLSLYNVNTGENWTLVSEMGAMFWFLYANDQHVYYNKTLLSEDNHILGTEINILSLDSGNEVTKLTLEPNALHDFLPVADRNEIWLAAEYEGRNVIMRWDMANPNEYIGICQVASSVEYMTAYRGGVLFEMDKPGAKLERDIYFWDGESDPYPFFITTHDIFSVGDAVLYTDDIVYDINDICDVLGSYDLSAASREFSVQPSDRLAESNMPYWGERIFIASADGMAAVASGTIYDARKGWFTQIPNYGDYKIVGDNISSDNALVLFDLDTSYPGSMDSMFDGKIVAVYVVKRK